MRSQPLGRLAGDADDLIEVSIVVEEDRVVSLGDGRDQEIDRCRAAVVAASCQRGLRLYRKRLGRRVDGKRGEMTQGMSECSVIDRAAR